MILSFYIVTCLTHDKLLIDEKILTLKMLNDIIKSADPENLEKALSNEILRFS
jgi:hypothetical protein